ncbi:AraC family transcriptional regulator [Ruegeria sp. HKCCSP335]|nr:AraC family transcriptional regulator [Ruegeria sp. HKCCSP335]
MVTIRELAHVVELLEDFAGASTVTDALQAAGLDRSVLSLKAGFAPYASEGILVETVARAMGDRLLGARIGRIFDYARYGAYSSFVLSAPDLATALARGARAFLLIHPGSEIVFRQTETHVVVGRSAVGLTVMGHRHLDEGSVFVLVTVIRHFLGKGWHPDWIELPHEARVDVPQIEEMIGASVRLRDSPPSIAIRLRDLQTRNCSPRSLDANIDLDDLAALMGVNPVQTIGDAVEQILQITVANADMSEETVASHLAIGPRTLQRALRQEGTSFNAVQSRFAKSKAQHLLTHTDRSIDQIASTLGYKDPRSFRRAFNRWTGVSPSLYRTQRRTGSDPVLAD